MVKIEKPDFENMSNSKKYFIIGIGVFFVILIIFILFVGGGEKGKGKGPKAKGDLTIRTVGQSNEKFNSFITSSKKDNNMTNVNISVKNFPDYESYYYALSSAFINDTAPDIFALNNNDHIESVFINKIEGLTSNDISLNDFSKNFSSVFVKDLIRSEKNGDIGKEITYLIGVPLGYESIGVFYNKKILKNLSLSVPKAIKSWAGINNIIDDLKKYDSSIIPIGLGLGNRVTYSNDILASLITQDGSETISGGQTKKTISNYLEYRIKGSSLKKSKNDKTDIELFKNRKLAIILGYPRILSKIGNFSDKNYILGSPFPRASSSKNNLFINYNYYVVNGKSQNILLAKKLLAYFASEKGAENYFGKFNSYLIPAQEGLVVDFGENKINKNYGITFSSVIDRSYDLTSFDKKITFIYNNQIKKILDSEAYEFPDLFKKLIKRLDNILSVMK